jgi:hypothetical protein
VENFPHRPASPVLNEISFPSGRTDGAPSPEIPGPSTLCNYSTLSHEGPCVAAMDATLPFFRSSSSAPAAMHGRSDHSLAHIFLFVSCCGASEGPELFGLPLSRISPITHVYIPTIVRQYRVVSVTRNNGVFVPKEEREVNAKDHLHDFSFLLSRRKEARYRNSR